MRAGQQRALKARERVRKNEAAAKIQDQVCARVVGCVADSRLSKCHVGLGSVCPARLFVF